MFGLHSISYLINICAIFIFIFYGITLIVNEINCENHFLINNNRKYLISFEGFIGVRNKITYFEPSWYYRELVHKKLTYLSCLELVRKKTCWFFMLWINKKTCSPISYIYSLMLTSQLDDLIIKKCNMLEISFV